MAWVNTISAPDIGATQAYSLGLGSQTGGEDNWILCIKVYRGLTSLSTQTQAFLVYGASQFPRASTAVCGGRSGLMLQGHGLEFAARGRSFGWEVVEARTLFGPQAIQPFRQFLTSVHGELAHLLLPPPHCREAGGMRDFQ